MMNNLLLHKIGFTNLQQHMMAHTKWTIRSTLSKDFEQLKNSKIS